MKKKIFLIIIMLILLSCNTIYAKYILTREFSMLLKSGLFYFEAVLSGEDIVEIEDKQAKFLLTVSNNDKTNWNKTDTIYEISINNDKFTFTVDGQSPTNGIVQKTIAGNEKRDQQLELTIISKDDTILGTSEPITININSTSKYAKEINIDVQVKDEYEGFEYTGAGQTYEIPRTGYYSLETWGASGYSYSEEYHGGYGAYSTGKIYLEAGTTVYVYTGGQGVGGNQATTYEGGFNGGGNGVLDNDSKYTGSGGGATHIAFVDGELSELENEVDDILIVSGGGGAVYYEMNYLFLGGHGGGIEGTSGIQIKDEGALNGPANALSGGGTQTAGGTAGRQGAAGRFGHGGEQGALSIGGGGGFYGGGSAWAASAGGGSGYIGNANLFDKHMIVYSENPTTLAQYVQAVTSDEAQTATNAVTSYSTMPIPDVAKSGDGYARITYLGGDEEGGNEEITEISIFGKTYPIIQAEPTLTNSSNNTNDESGLYKSTATNTEEPTYYFRGNVTDNYVSFAGFIWRIVRINEDGTIRIIMQNGINNNGNSQFNPTNTDYTQMYYSNSDVNNGAMRNIETWYTNNIANNDNYASKVATGNYFYEQAKISGEAGTTSGNATMTVYTDYDEPNFRCETDGNDKGFVNSRVGLITYDEMLFAGGYYGTESNYYLNNGQITWAMSPAGYTGTGAQVWRMDANGSIVYGRVTYTNRTLRPVINLKADATATGDGTEGTPFTIQ